MAPQVLSHAQAGPLRRAQARDTSGDSMPPPPLPSARVPDPRLRRPPATPQPQPDNGHPLPQRPSFNPLEAQPPPSGISGGSQRFVNQTPMKAYAAGPPRSLTPVSHINAQQPQRFVPAGTPRLPTATASTSSGSMGGLGLVSHSSSRSLATPAGSGGQRTPFVPGGRFS